MTTLCEGTISIRLDVDMEGIDSKGEMEWRIFQALMHKIKDWDVPDDMEDYYYTVTLPDGEHVTSLG